MKKFLFYSASQLICRDSDGDGDGTGAGDGAGSGDGTGAGGDAGGHAGDDTDAFSAKQQEKVNSLLAAERRKSEAKSKETETRLAKVLENKSLSDDERSRLEDTLEDLRTQHMTEKQKSARELEKAKTEYETSLDDAKKQAVHWQGMYTESNINRALQDAAVANDAYQAGQIVTILKPYTQMVEDVDSDGKPNGNGLVPRIAFPDKDNDTGEPITTSLTPADAVKRMKEIPDLYGNLFKSNAAGGIGGTNATDGSSSGSSVDYENISMEEYAKLRKENPKALGLK